MSNWTYKKVKTDTINKVQIADEIDNNWIDDFISIWSTLEIEYASALSDNKKVLDDRAITEINRSLKKLDKLISNLLKNDNSHENQLSL